MPHLLRCFLNEFYRIRFKILKTPSKAYIFDIDGTLVDSNDYHAHAWTRALDEAGLCNDFASVRPLIGMGGDKLLKTLTGIEQSTEVGKSISNRATEIFKNEYMSQIKSFPGVSSLVSYFKESGCSLIIATSAEEGVVDTLLDVAGVKNMFDGITSSADVQSTKPDPDLILAALKKLDNPKEDVVMVGDTRFDVEAARRAGIRSVTFRCGGSPEIELKEASEIYDDAKHYLHSFTADARKSADSHPLG